MQQVVAKESKASISSTPSLPVATLSPLSLPLSLSLWKYSSSNIYTERPWLCKIIVYIIVGHWEKKSQWDGSPMYMETNEKGNGKRFGMQPSRFSNNKWINMVSYITLSHYTWNRVIDARSDHIIISYHSFLKNRKKNKCWEWIW